MWVENKNMSIEEIIKLTLPVNYPIIKQVQKHLSNKLRFVFRNFPITQIHPQAQHAAEAVESTAAQNKFWDMHDHLYEHQQALDDNHLEKYEQPYWRELL
jgi:protein-disulfide isomerase